MNEDEPTPDQPLSGVDLDPDELSPGALRGIVEEYVTREGTDYGLQELSLYDKVRRLRRQLDAGELKLLYDMESEEWDLLPAADAERLLDN